MGQDDLVISEHTDTLLCGECGVGHLKASEWESEFESGGVPFRVAGLECYRCDHCGADPVFTEQIRRNERRIDLARQAVQRPDGTDDA